MKKIISNTFIVSTLLLASCVSVSSPTETKNDNKSDNVQNNNSENQTQTATEEDKAPVLDGIAFDVNFGKSVIGGKILDAASRDLINKNVKITVSGDDADKLEKTELETNNGFIDLITKSGVKPSESEPLFLTVVAHSENYFSSSVPLVIENQNGSSFELKLVNKEKTPEGIISEKASGNLDASGALKAPITISKTEQISKTTSSVILSENTVMRDKSGKILTGDIDVDVAFYNNQSESSLDSFPGGLGFADVTGTNGQQTNGYFETAGFVSVDIKDKNGNMVEKFDKPVTIKMEISPDTINPDTGLNVKAGDTIDIWSHDVNTGKWKNEGKGTVQTGEKGNFEVQYQINHLSYWNMDWHYGTKCAPKLIVNWKSPTKIYPLNISFEFDGARQAFRTTGTIKEDFSEITNVPTGRPLKMTVYRDKNRKKEIIGTKTQTLTVSNKTRWVSGFGRQYNCNESLTLDLINPDDTLKTFVSGSIIFMDKTNNKEIKIRPSIDFWYKSKSENEWDRGRMEGGNAKLYVIPGQEYEFKILYNGEEYIREYTFKKDEKSIELEGLDFRALDYSEFIANINK